MMLQTSELATLRDAYAAADPNVVKGALAQLGSPTDAEVVAAALTAIENMDRNVRSMALRILAHHPGDAALPGILRGLSDREQRVRNVAIQSSKSFLAFPAVAQRLAQIAQDAAEKPKLCRQAIMTLAGYGAATKVDPLPEAAAEQLHRLITNEAHRPTILLYLLRLPLSERVEQLLQAFAQRGNEHEKTMVAKARAGYRVANLGEFDEAERRIVKKECELAAGQVFYWVKRDKQRAI